MTDGHKHHTVSVKGGGLVHRVLTQPLICTRNEAWVDASRFPFGLCGDHQGSWYLSLLGMLHGLTGLTIKLKD